MEVLKLVIVTNSDKMLPFSLKNKEIIGNTEHTQCGRFEFSVRSNKHFLVEILTLFFIVFFCFDTDT